MTGIVKIFNICVWSLGGRLLQRLSVVVFMARLSKLGIRFGVLSQVGSFCNISGISQLDVGNNVNVGDKAWIAAEGGLHIGDNTYIARIWQG